MVSQSPTGMYLTIDVHYSGVFAQNPLKYLDLEKITVRDVDFGGFSYKEFLLWLRNLTNGSCDNVYYCSRKETLGEGIIRIDSDADYWEFVEATYTPEAELDVYIDQQNDPILDWAENEVLSNGNRYDSEEEDENVEEDDSEEDDNLDGIMAYEHEEDEEVHTFNKTVGGDFLNKLSGKLSDDDEPNDGKDEKVVFPIHDENQAWDKMMPILGMKFANPMQLKLCLTNYAVKNGYDLWYEKSDHNRLLVKCCKGKVNVELNQEIDLESDSDNEVQREPDSEVESYEVDYEEGEYQARDVDQVEQVEVEVIQDPIGQDDQGQAVVQDPVEEEHMMEVPAFQVLQGKRRRKRSERITKIQIRKKWEGKEGSSCDKLMELD
ncbi:unnamed protein product [Lactuca saligna]|uniref:Transposase MuDR plant domain-containing protein n=1 Tax=Lactuca saligna TaxID=75948 RepID=A0AA35ZPX7_LACSI|nr:unnamed protein product [Lactuca saligna]